MESRDLAAEYIASNGWRVIADFTSLLQMPNVTGHTEDLRRNASEIARRFNERSAVVDVVEIDGASPVVVGELRCSRPTATVGVYIHYDGQPVDPANWTYPPFSATLTTGPIHAGGQPTPLPQPGEPINPDWRIYARGASDDKTPLAAFLAALDTLGGTERTVDLVFLFEGEEESGSPNLGRYMEELRPRLQADLWLLCDGPVHQSRRPQVSFGARGYSGFDLTFFGPERELHSGHYGNWVPNPAFELARFLSTCKDEAGHVNIEGFYDLTRPVTEADRAAMAALPDVEDQLLAELGFAGAEADDANYPERLLVPSFNVRGLAAADVGEAARNVIPDRATASVDMRLAAGDDPERMIELVRAHLAGQGYVVLDREPTPEERRTHRRLARLDPSVGYRAARIPMDSAAATALLDVCARASGEDPVALPTFGGSVPLYLFEDLLDSPVAVLPIANHDNNQHAPDENLRIANLWYGISLWTTLLTSDFTAINSQTT